MAKAISLLYGLFAYVVFFLTFLYAIAFVGGFWAPRTVDAGLTASTVMALVVDAVLLSIFAVQHSVMARPWFKRAWTMVVPKQVERSTYVLLSSLCLILLYWQWRTIPGVVWEARSTTGRAALEGLFWLGWLLVLVGTCLIDHFELFGLRQVMSYVRGQEYAGVAFKEPLLYKWCRHPIMLGFIVAFWAAPRMTWGHLLFAVATTGYILLAIQFEEHDLIHAYGEKYKNYRKRTSMLLPLMRKGKG